MVTRCYGGLQGFSGGYRGLKRVTGVYKLGVTKGYSGLQKVTKG